MSKQAGWAAFGIIAVTGLVVAGCAIASSSESPREFIGKKYDCDSDPTKQDRATCDATGTPDAVSDAISADTYPIDTESASGNVSSYECDDGDTYGDNTDDPFGEESSDPFGEETTDDTYSSSNSDLCSESDLPYEEQTVYMQYEDDIVVVSKGDSGATVDVYDYEDGYRSHSSHFAVFGWSSSGGSSSRGGGGFGGGK